jgi:prevent-host-death family protein
MFCFSFLNMDDGSEHPFYVDDAILKRFGAQRCDSPIKTASRLAFPIQKRIIIDRGIRTMDKNGEIGVGGIDISEFKEKLPSMAETVEKGGPVVVNENGKWAFVVVSPSDFALLSCCLAIVKEASEDADSDSDSDIPSSGKEGRA